MCPVSRPLRSQPAADAVGLRQAKRETDWRPTILKIQAMTQPKTIGTAQKPVIIAAPFGPDAIRAMGAHKAPERPGKVSQSPRRDRQAIAWPESLREAARVLGFALTVDSIPCGIVPESEEWKLAEPVPSEVRRGTPGALLLNEYINGMYNGQTIGQSMASGGKIHLETLLNIFSVNDPIYSKTKSYHTLSKLLDRLASAAGRYVILTEDGLLSLTEQRPESAKTRKRVAA